MYGWNIVNVSECEMMLSYGNWQHGNEFISKVCLVIKFNEFLHNNLLTKYGINGTWSRVDHYYYHNSRCSNKIWIFSIFICAIMFDGCVRNMYTSIQQQQNPEMKNI